MTNDTFTLLRKREFGDVINDTFRFLKINATAIIQALLLFVLPFFIIGGYMFGRFYGVVLGESLNGNQDPTIITNIVKNQIGPMLLGIGGLIFGSIMLAMTAICSFLSYENNNNSKISLKNIIASIQANLGNFILFHILFVLVLGIVLIVAIIILAATAAISPAIMIFGIIALYIGYIYTIVALIFSPIIYLRENTGIFEAMSNSFRLIKGNWWRSFGIIFVTYIIVIVLMGVFSIPFYVVLFSMMQHITDPSAVATKLETFMAPAFSFIMIGGVISSIILYGAIILNYYSLKEEKDGDSIFEEIDSITT